MSTRFVTRLRLTTISKLTAFFISSMIDRMINVEDEKKEEVIDKNESDESEMFFISSMINCMINVKDENKNRET